MQLARGGFSFDSLMFRVCVVHAQIVDESGGDAWTDEVVSDCKADAWKDREAMQREMEQPSQA